jgi:hypothetical protein
MPDFPTPGSVDRIRWSKSTGNSCMLDEEKRYEVRMEPEDDPQRLSLLRRWLAVITIAVSAHFVTFASSAVRFHFRYQLSAPNPNPLFLGSVLRAPHREQLSCWTRSRHFVHKLVCYGPGRRPSFCRSNIRALWA